MFSVYVLGKAKLMRKLERAIYRMKWKKQVLEEERVRKMRSRETSSEQSSTGS